jgi:hypothetical protein
MFLAREIQAKRSLQFKPEEQVVDNRCLNSARMKSTLKIIHVGVFW